MNVKQEAEIAAVQFSEDFQPQDYIRPKKKRIRSKRTSQKKSLRDILFVVCKFIKTQRRQDIQYQDLALVACLQIISKITMDKMDLLYHQQCAYLFRLVLCKFGLYRFIVLYQPALTLKNMWMPFRIASQFKKSFVSVCELISTGQYKQNIALYTEGQLRMSPMIQLLKTNSRDLLNPDFYNKEQFRWLLSMVHYYSWKAFCVLKDVQSVSFEQQFLTGSDSYLEQTQNLISENDDLTQFKQNLHGLALLILSESRQIQHTGFNPEKSVVELLANIELVDKSKEYQSRQAYFRVLKTTSLLEAYRSMFMKAQPSRNQKKIDKSIQEFKHLCISELQNNQKLLMRLKKEARTRTRQLEQAILFNQRQMTQPTYSQKQAPIAVVYNERRDKNDVREDWKSQNESVIQGLDLIAHGRPCLWTISELYLQEPQQIWPDEQRRLQYNSQLKSDLETVARDLLQDTGEIVSRVLQFAKGKKWLDLTFKEKTCYNNAIHYRATVVNGSELLLPCLISNIKVQTLMISSTQQIIDDADSVYSKLIEIMTGAIIKECE